jgi:uncharacterized protein (TIRG00374 family)
MARPRLSSRNLLLGAVSVVFVVATFVFFLPQIANYSDVWEVVRDLSWEWIVALIAVTLLNLATFAPPWMVTLPGLSFVQAMKLTQASTALAILVPAGTAAGVAGSYGILRSWGYKGSEITRAITLTSLWNQFLNLSYPVVAVFLLTVTGESAVFALAIAAFIGVAILGVVVTGFVVILVNDRLARDIGDVAARFATWSLGKVRRGPVTWTGESFESFRRSAAEFLARRWHLLTAASLAGSLSVFVVFFVSLRALDVPPSQVSLVEAFAAWSFIRIIASIPITPGGIGVVELGMTGMLVGFGGNNAGVVAAVLVFRFLTAVPTLLLGLAGALTLRRHRPPKPEISPGPGDEVAEEGARLAGGGPPPGL